MWRSIGERVESAEARLRLAWEVWGWRPHPAQRRWFCSPAQIRVAACGRRWGKTEGLSVDVASLALAEAAAGRDCRQLVVAPTDAQARLLGEAVASRVQAAFDDGSPWTEGLRCDTRLRPSLQVTVRPEGLDVLVSNHKRARGGGPAVARVLCRTAARDGASLRGLWAHRIVVDEAARVPDVVMTEVLLPMLMDVGGEYVLASSPWGRRSAYYRLFARGAPAPEPTSLPCGQGPPTMGGSGRQPGVPTPNPPIVGGPQRSGEVGSGPEDVTYASFQCPTADNPHTDGAFLDSMRDELGDAMYAQEILAEFSEDDGGVFHEDDIVGCLASDGRTTLTRGDLLSDPQPGRFYSAGIDWGRRQDFTVVCILDATETPARLVHLQRWHGTNWDDQLRAVAGVLARFGPVRTLADGNSLGDPLIEALAPAVAEAQAALGQFGARPARLERFTFTADSKQKLVDHLTLGLSGRRLLYPHHPVLLGELRGFEYGPPGASGRAPMAARGSGHDDCVMALALAWWCAPAAAPEPPASRILLGSQVGYGHRGW